MSENDAQCENCGWGGPAREFRRVCDHLACEQCARAFDIGEARGREAERAKAVAWMRERAKKQWSYDDDGVLTDAADEYLDSCHDPAPRETSEAGRLDPAHDSKPPGGSGDGGAVCARCRGTGKVGPCPKCGGTLGLCRDHGCYACIRGLCREHGTSCPDCRSGGG